MWPNMTLKSRHVSIESDVQVVTVSPSEISRLLDAQIPPSVNRDAVKNGIRFEILAEYDAHIPAVVSRVWCPGHHRESL